MIFGMVMAPIYRIALNSPLFANDTVILFNAETFAGKAYCNLPVPLFLISNVIVCTYAVAVLVSVKN